MTDSILEVGSSAPPITDWISAVATAVLGLTGLGVTIWQWRASGFRPRYQAWIDSSRMGIFFNIQNSGRAPGIIPTVHVAKPEAQQRFTPMEDQIKYAGFRGESFQGFILPGQTLSRHEDFVAPGHRTERRHRRLNIVKVGVLQSIYCDEI